MTKAADAKALEVVMVPGESVDFDLARLESALKDVGKDCSRILFACPGPSVDKRLVELTLRHGLGWESFHSENLVQAVNRALLLSSQDTLVLGAPVLGFNGWLGAMRDVLAHSDRAGIVVAGSEALGASWAETVAASWPEATDLPCPDVAVVLLRRAMLGMAGFLDERVAGLGDALADLCLRAQRLGFRTLRSNRSLIRERQGFAPSFPASGLLTDRHPYYAAQRQWAERDVAVQAPARVLRGSSDQLSVCLDLRYLPEGAINGTGVYAVELIRALRSHTPAQLQLCVATEAQREALKPLDLPVRLADAGLPADTQLLHRPAQVFRREDLGFLLRSPVPFVITFQDLIAYRAGSVFAEGEEHVRYQLTSYVAVRSAQATIAISEHNRREILGEFGVPEDSVTTVYHGVDPTAFARSAEDDPAESLRKHQLPKRFFLFIGSDYAHKNLKLLLAAYEEFRSKWTERRDIPGLVIVGHPSGTRDGVLPYLRQNPRPGVHLLSGVSSQVLRALYHSAIAFVYPSTYEGFGLPILEAMAAQTPVLCSRLTSIPEVAGDAALYAEQLDDAGLARQLLALASSPGLCHELAEKGLRQAAKFTWKQTALGTYAAYQAALERPAARSLTERRFLTELASRPLLG